MEAVPTTRKRGRRPGIPAYRTKAAAGHVYGVVTLYDPASRVRRDYKLGRDGDVARERYARIVAEWLAAGRRLPDAARTIRPRPDDLTVSSLCFDYLKWAATRHTANEIACQRAAVRVLRGLYGSTAAAAFGPNCLRAVRAAMIQGRPGEPGRVTRRPWRRKTVTGMVHRIRAIWRWAAAHEKLPETVYAALRTLEPLRWGEAQESIPVGPAPDADVDAVLAVVLPPVRAMIELQRATGMRPGEVVLMRLADLDYGDVWTYTPHRHKGTHRRHVRTVWLGPRARDVLKPWILAAGTAGEAGYLFRPTDAVLELRRRRRAARVTPEGQGNGPSGRTPARPAGDRYRRDSYARAIRRACRAAGVAPWHPHQLRHNYATLVRAAHGIETARIMLGHRTIDVTEIYAERDAGLAARVATELG